MCENRYQQNLEFQETYVACPPHLLLETRTTNSKANLKHIPPYYLKKKNHKPLRLQRGNSAYYLRNISAPDLAEIALIQNYEQFPVSILKNRYKTNGTNEGNYEADPKTNENLVQ